MERTKAQIVNGLEMDAIIYWVKQYIGEKCPYTIAGRLYNATGGQGYSQAMGDLQVALESTGKYKDCKDWIAITITKLKQRGTWREKEQADAKVYQQKFDLYLGQKLDTISVGGVGIIDELNKKIKELKTLKGKEFGKEKK
jgi:hypothetical protein